MSKLGNIRREGSIYRATVDAAEPFEIALDMVTLKMIDMDIQKMSFEIGRAIGQLVKYARDVDEYNLNIPESKEEIWYQSEKFWGFSKLFYFSLEKY